MSNFEIAFVDQLSKEHQDKMEQGLLEYEKRHGIDVNYQPFALELYNKHKQLVGILDGFSSYSSVHIVDLWVDKAYRGQGYGKQLVAEVERLFKNKGFDNINLVSCAFQAPEFYVKCGFKVEFVRENKTNPKLSTTFLVKFFD